MENQKLSSRILQLEKEAEVYSREKLQLQYEHEQLRRTQEDAQSKLAEYQKRYELSQLKTREVESRYYTEQSKVIDLKRTISKRTPKYKMLPDELEPTEQIPVDKSLLLKLQAYVQQLLSSKSVSQQEIETLGMLVQLESGRKAFVTSIKQCMKKLNSFILADSSFDTLSFLLNKVLELLEQDFFSGNLGYLDHVTY